MPSSPPILPLRASVSLPAVGKRGTGWLPPAPDLRDFTSAAEPVLDFARNVGMGAPQDALKTGIPSSVDLRQWCSPIEDQGMLGSCTAQAGVGIMEYYQNRMQDNYVNGSRLFVYKVTRKLLGLVGDTGAWLRNTMGAMALIGVPPERYWPYTDQSEPGTPDAYYFDSEPSAFVYTLADRYDAVSYFCHDPLTANIPPADVLDSVKLWVAWGFPAMFGFFGFPSFGSTTVPGGIPYPCPDEAAQWGHAIVAVGYDDYKEVDNTQCGTSETGALLIRNSWSTGWGDNGYGWMPYRYVLDGIALDFWTLIAADFTNLDAFGLPGD